MIRPRVLLEGLAFGESPRWHGGRLWLCNWGAAEIVAVDPRGGSEVMLTVPTSLPFSIDWLPDGRLLVICGRESLLLRQEADGALVTHADLSGLVAGCNEIVVDGRGNAYVNGGARSGPGAIVLVPAEGPPRRVAEAFEFPNGMAVTADNSTLIIAESHGNRLTAFDIAADGGLSNRRVWADLGDGFPDGICIDAGGCVWYADVPGRCCVRVAEGGQVLDRVELDRGGFACMLGEGGLYITAAQWRGMEKMFDEARTGQVLVADVKVGGAGWPARS